MGVMTSALLCLFAFLAVIAFMLVFLPVFSRNPPPLHIICSTITRDLKCMFALFKVYMLTYYFYRRDLTVPKIFEELVRSHPDKTCFIFKDEKWSFQKVEDFSNRVANAFARAGYKKGDDVALVMHNCPEYACMWLGLSKIGVVTALVNTNLRMHSLAHCINIVPVKAIIFDAESIEAIENTAPLIKEGRCTYYCFGNLGNRNNTLSMTSLDELLQNEGDELCFADAVKAGFRDKLIYIYTSGTTGLPKAAIIRNRRYLMNAALLRVYGKLRGDDVMYNILPMYHTVGGMLYLSNSLIFGNTTVIKTKFSAKEFWTDAVKYKVTIGIYIGEICRFLLSQPIDPMEKSHTIRMMYGTGLRQQIWTEFEERFRIPQITEIYGCTEGTAYFVNIFGKPGAIGVLPRTFSRLFPTNIIRINMETEQPIRDENGLCILCKPGEIGVAVGNIRAEHHMLTFDGYVDRDESKKKIITDCFAKGDRVFFTGDLVAMSEEGFVYFVDRIGDTFRWRSENVSTNEVEMVISKLLDLTPCIAYGVHIPGAEGRAGMVTIQSEDILDMKMVHEKVKSALPSYAIPVFVRFRKKLELTGTFKFIKGDLQRESYDIQKVQDPIFFLHPSQHKYVRLDMEMYKLIVGGKLRL